MIFNERGGVSRSAAAWVSLALLFSVVAAGPALAVGASLPGSGFEIDSDANLKVDLDGIDWRGLANTTNPFPDPLPPGVEELRANDEPTGKGDNSYKGGTKEDTVCPAETTGSIPNNKSDLLTFHVYEEPGVGDHPGFLNLAWSRVSDPSGTTLMDFEFNQSTTPCAQGPNVLRTPGDLLIEYTIDQGGARADISGRFWSGTEWGSSVDLDSGTACGGGPCAVGTINQTLIPAGESDGLGEKQPRTFGEAQLDLRLIFDEQQCTSFGSAMLKSRSSDSFTAQLKDFIAPIPISLNNCAKVVVEKQTDPDGVVGTFDFAKSFDTDPSSPNSFSLSDDGVKDFGANVLFGSNYTVIEDGLPAGFELIDIDCSAKSSGVSPTINLETATVTFDLDSDDDVLWCTFTNRIRGKVNILKTDDTSAVLEGVNFELFNDLAPLGGSKGGEDTATGKTCTTGVLGTCSIEDIVPGLYWVVEDTSTLPSGYDPAADQLITIDGGNLEVSLTFVNPRQKGSILIEKTRKHAAASSDTNPHDGVNFVITGPGLGSGVTVTTDGAGRACYDGLILSQFVGDYTVTEDTPDGYFKPGGLDPSQTVSVDLKSTCGDGSEKVVTFSNTPLTDVMISVDSQIHGGTSTVIVCWDGPTTDGPPDYGPVTTDPNATSNPGDGSLTIADLPPTDPNVTLTCQITIDP